MNNKKRLNFEGFTSTSTPRSPSTHVSLSASNEHGHRSLKRVKLSPQARSRPTAGQDRAGSKASLEQNNSLQNKDVNISIKLTLPTDLVNKTRSISKAAGHYIRHFPRHIKTFKWSNLAEIRSHRHFRKGAVAVLALALIFGIWQVFLNKSPARPGAVAGAENGIDINTPAFTPLVPSNKKDIVSKYDSQRRVVSFSDQLAGINITVSQQMLPEAFKLDPAGSVEEMAKKFNATTPIKADDTTAYAGKSADGPQSIIFQIDGKLVFIYAPYEIAHENISKYIKSLE